MRVPVKIISFSCFLFSINFVQGQDITCTAPAIPNGQVVERMAEYQKGAILEYRCHAGFKKKEGIPRCTKSGWTLKPECDEVTCTLQSTTFGIRKIKPEGKTIFRAGESVEIICDEKFLLIFTKQKSKTFTCQGNGQWDHQPICQEIRCEVPRDQHVRSPEYYFRGDKKLGTKQYYYCEDGYEKMAEVATCTEDGWTPNPLCADITCTAPAILNGQVVEQMAEYQEGAILEYICNPWFKKKEGIPRCTKSGWTLKPECDGVTCTLPSTTFGIRKIKPEGKTIFRAEESVEIICDEKFLFIFTKQKSKTFTCQENGQWDHQPICQEIRCEVPRDQHVRSPEYYFRGDKKLGTKQYYYCEDGYEKMAAGATCTEDGWTPNPLCAKVTCHFESTTPGVKGIIPEGKTIFKVGESVEIICSEKNFLFTKDIRKSFTCQSNGKWDSKPVCEITCEVPHDQHLSGPEYYFSGNMKLGAKRSYSCKSGYRKMAEEATCTRDGWTPNPLCDEIMCDPPKTPNAEIAGGQKLKYKIDSRIEYKCHPGYEPEGPVEITCDSQGHWTGIQQCTDGTCQEQELNNIKIVFGHPSIDSPYKPGHSLIFQCTDDKMIFYGRRAIECLPDGRWNYPYPQCGGTVECSKPTKNLQFVTLSEEKTEYSNSEMLTYTCKKPYNEIPGAVLMCQNGNWNGTFDCKSKICPPPPYLENGDFDTVSTKDNVTTAVSYTCQPYYVLTKQQDVYKCVDGKWETPPKCLRPCEIDDIVEKYNLQPPTEKVFIKHADKYRLNCKVGWNTGSEMKAYVDVSCSNGNVQIDKSCDAQNNGK